MMRWLRALPATLRRLVEHSNVAGRLRCDFRSDNIPEESLLARIQHELLRFAQEAITAPKSLIGSDLVYTCDAVLIVRSSDLPRRPLTGELIHHPRNTAWQIAEVTEIRGFYQLALNRASSGF
jgi:hypothetical protein